MSNMGSRAVQYRAPQYDVDASQQTYLVQKLRPVRDPRTMPKVVGGPDWSPAASRVGKAFRVAAPHGATVRAGAALDSREVAVLAQDSLVEVIDATSDERRVRVEGVLRLPVRRVVLGARRLQSPREELVLRQAAAGPVVGAPLAAPLLRARLGRRALAGAGRPLAARRATSRSVASAWRRRRPLHYAKDWSGASRTAAARCPLPSYTSVYRTSSSAWATLKYYYTL